MRPARLLRRGYSLLHKRGNQQQAGPEQRTNLQKYDEEKYGGWKSAEMLFGDEVPRKSLIGRADWHVVQFLLAMVPPGMMLLLIHWARYDMNKLEERTRQEMLEKESQKMEAVAEHQRQKQLAGKAGQSAGTGAAAATAAATAAAAETNGAGGNNEVEVRLSRLEALVQALEQARQEGGMRAAEKRAAAEAVQQGEQAAAGQREQDGGQQVVRQAVQHQREPQQAPGAAVEARQQQQQQPATGPAVAQQEQQEEEEQRQAAPSLAQQVAGALRWAGSWLTLPSQQTRPAEDEPAGASEQGSSGSSSSRSGGDTSSSGGSSSHDAAAALGVHTAGAEPAAAPGGGASSPSMPAAPEASASASRPPGNAANWLLHAAGRPLRWLRSKPAPPDAEVAEEERRLRSWLQQKPEDSE